MTRHDYSVRAAEAATWTATVTAVDVVSHTIGSETSGAAGAPESAEIECVHSTSGTSSHAGGLEESEEKV